MGCGSSRITVVEPAKSGGPDTTTEIEPLHGSPRGDSAISKNTTDSGVGLETGDASVPPRTVSRILLPLRAQSPGLNQESQRPESSVILEQLLSQGIIPAQNRVAASGEAYNIMLAEGEVPKKRPPPRLESLKIRKEQEVTRKEDLDEKMRQVEERRKIREEELRNRLRVKSARPRGAALANFEKEMEPEVESPLSPHIPTTAKDPDMGSSGEEATKLLSCAGE
ncbi:Stathmin domain-containing protein 1 [Bagarius yarrelli]|uniref:Stathmin domain-containing protein 1 n=1 Tax=Bagarius yarrelli TaxID=175774 RepID=A0A556TPA9_BAGYA|nr:Stathmin domain-containing protein 1 [Bagarius yarrelli]